MKRLRGDPFEMSIVMRDVSLSVVGSYSAAHPVTTVFCHPVAIVWVLYDSSLWAPPRMSLGAAWFGQKCPLFRRDVSIGRMERCDNPCAGHIGALLRSRLFWERQMLTTRTEPSEHLTNMPGSLDHVKTWFEVPFNTTSLPVCPGWISTISTSSPS
jgi:hypothetical protein